ncbi:MAG: DnaJ family domain-containing protein [Pseudomonadota bacterium]|uniref:DnaJ family domain-containing protein n=1 Tax=Thermithiobacillus tepidarius TaxID=929 RepID=UPI0003F7AD56|nr:DnaJ family domain-containing protein [Thermithiobacillus tepidarius]
MGIIEKLAEERILEAMQRGEFDNLPGAGKPLQLEDLSMVPAELRMAYKVLKNAGCLPPELELQREIRQLSDLLGAVEDAGERQRAIKRLDYLMGKLSLMRGREVNVQIEAGYYEKLLRKLEKD